MIKNKKTKHKYKRYAADLDIKQGGNTKTCVV